MTGNSRRMKHTMCRSHFTAKGEAMEITTAKREDLREIPELKRTAFTKEAEEYDDFNIAPMTQTEAEPEAEQTAPAHL